MEYFLLHQITSFILKYISNFAKFHFIECSLVNIIIYFNNNIKICLYNLIKITFYFIYFLFL